MSITEQKIGRYALHEPVGRGAMGVVFRAEDPLIHRTVAVKVLDMAKGATPEQIALARARFMREAEAAGGIDHPNIIRVLDVGRGEGVDEMYIVMEFVAGPSVEALLHRGPLGVERALALIGQIASGLDAAHARGIVHRDIKPSNILLTEDETVAKIADFGITHVANSALTLDMKALGTPSYMSPEQVGGKSPDSRSDLFSFGVLAYEMLAGRKPFEGDDLVAVAHAIAHGTPLAISVAHPGLPRSFDGVFDRALSKSPSDRFGTAKELHEALAARASDEAAGASSARKPASPKWRRPFIGIAAVALLAAGFVLLLARGRPPATPASPIPSAPRPTASAAPPPRAAPAVAKPGPPRAAPKPAQPASRISARKAYTPRAEVPGRPPGPAAPKAAPVKAPVPAPVPVPDASLTVSVATRLRRGSLVVTADGKPIFDEAFSKSRMALVQTTVWDPLRVPAGEHVIVARVIAEGGKTYESDPTSVACPGGKAVSLHVRLKGDALTVVSGESDGRQAP